MTYKVDITEPAEKDAFLASNGFRMQRINDYLDFYIINSKTQTVSILKVIHFRQDWVSIKKTKCTASMIKNAFF